MSAATGVLGSEVLVLNNLYQAVHITSVRRAMCLLYKGLVRVVDADFLTYSFKNWTDLPASQGDDLVHTPSRAIRVPRVILLVDYGKLPRHEVRFTRRNIFHRDRNQCQYCGNRFTTTELNLDHVLPVSRGGGSTWLNVVCCCLRCNRVKANRTPAEAGMKLVRPPEKPRWHPLARMRLPQQRYQIWRSFIDAAYWNTELDEVKG